MKMNKQNFVDITIESFYQKLNINEITNLHINKFGALEFFEKYKNDKENQNAPFVLTTCSSLDDNNTNITFNLDINLFEYIYFDFLNLSMLTTILFYIYFNKSKNYNEFEKFNNYNNKSYYFYHLLYSYYGINNIWELYSDNFKELNKNNIQNMLLETMDKIIFQYISENKQKNSFKFYFDKEYNQKNKYNFLSSFFFLIIQYKIFGFKDDEIKNNLNNNFIKNNKMNKICNELVDKVLKILNKYNNIESVINLNVINQKDIDCFYKITKKFK